MQREFKREFREIIGELSVEARMESIANSRKADNYGTIPKTFAGISKAYEVKQINLSDLRFNTMNGRIIMDASALRSSLQESRLDVNNIGTQEEIFNALWDSDVSSNKKTLKSLKESGQREVGVITKDGVIIDGNRRASLLMRIAMEDELDDK